MEGWESGLIHQFAKLACLNCAPGVRIPLLPQYMFFVFIYMENVWEYDRVVIDFKTTNELKQELNALGAAGWEIVYYYEIASKKFGEPSKSIVLIKTHPWNGSP